MLEQAQSDNWEEVSLLEQERQVLLEAYFKKDAQRLDDELAIQVGIETMRELNRQIDVLGLQKKEELAGSLQEINQGKKAVKAYFN